MPILKRGPNSSLFKYPSDNYLLVKYLDITKFISLLQRESLFFCRLDILEDHFEGTTSSLNQEKRYEYFANQHNYISGDPKLTDREIVENVHKLNQEEEKFKKLVCVSCWNKSKNESAALWKIYSDLNKGIMITSKVRNIIEAFSETSENIEFTEVVYINYNTDIMPDSSKWDTIYHKHKAYEYENEVRLIFTQNFDTTLTYDWNKEEVQEGKYISLEIRDLIDEIIISPYAPQWFFELVKDIIQKYGLNKPVMASELSKN